MFVAPNRCSSCQNVRLRDVPSTTSTYSLRELYFPKVLIIPHTIPCVRVQTYIYMKKRSHKSWFSSIGRNLILYKLSEYNYKGQAWSLALWVNRSCIFTRIYYKYKGNSLGKTQLEGESFPITFSWRCRILQIKKCTKTLSREAGKTLDLRIWQSVVRIIDINAVVKYSLLGSTILSYSYFSNGFQAIDTLILFLRYVLPYMRVQSRFLRLPIYRRERERERKSWYELSAILFFTWNFLVDVAKFKI